MCNSWEPTSQILLSLDIIFIGWQRRKQTKLDMNIIEWVTCPITKCLFIDHIILIFIKLGKKTFFVAKLAKQEYICICSPNFWGPLRKTYVLIPDESQGFRELVTGPGLAGPAAEGAGRQAERGGSPRETESRTRVPFRGGYSQEIKVSIARPLLKTICENRPPAFKDHIHKVNYLYTN